MKKISYIFVSLLALASCNKVTPPVCGELSQNAITFNVNDLAIDVESSKAAITDVTTDNLSSIYVSASSGAGGSSETAWSTLSNSQISINTSTHKGSSTAYWPASGTLNFYATNWSVTKTISASDCTLSVANYNGGLNDHIAGFKSNATNGAEFALDFNHIYSRLYDIKFTRGSHTTGATINSISVTPAKNGGTYSFRNNSWNASGTGTVQTITPSTTSIGATATSIGQSAVDRTFIPGSVTISVTYTITATGYSNQFTKSATVNLPQGQKSVIKATLTDDASPISFSVSVHNWDGPTDVDATLS